MVFGSEGGKIEGGVPVCGPEGAATGQFAILAKCPIPNPFNRHNNNYMLLSLTPDQKQSVFWLALWLAFVVLLYALGPVLTPFIAAAMLAYALNGGVDAACAVRLGR